MGVKNNLNVNIIPVSSSKDYGTILATYRIPCSLSFKSKIPLFLKYYKKYLLW